MRTAILALTALFLLAFAAPVRADAATDTPSITVWGKSTIYVVPDRAIISVAVYSDDEDYAKAAAANHASAEKLLAALKVIGVAEKDIESGYTSAYQGFGWYSTYSGFSANKSDDNKYHVARSYAITLTDLKRIDKVLDTAMQNGANHIDGVDLQTSQIQTYRDQARAAAVLNAKSKADLLAKQLGATVGKPKTIDETGTHAIYASGGINGGATHVAGPEDTEPAPVFMVGKIPVEAAVLVTFELKLIARVFIPSAVVHPHPQTVHYLPGGRGTLIPDEDAQLRRRACVESC